MHIRRFISFLVGCWMGGSMLMMWISSATLDSVARLLVAQPQKMQQIIFTMTDAEKKSLFFYAANELNRYFLDGWGLAQIGVGIVVLALLLAARQDKWLLVLASSMLMCVLASYFLIAPLLLALGRSLDFASLSQLQAERRQQESLFILQSSLEVVKILLGCGLTFLLARRAAGEKRRRRSQPVEETPYPNYGRMENP